MTKDFFEQKGKAGIEADIFAAAFEFRCPHLGSRSDPATALGYANAANRCYKQEPPAHIDQPKQSEFCLSGNHVNCPIFLEIVAAEEPAAEQASKLLLPLTRLQRLRQNSVPSEPLRLKERSLKRMRSARLSVGRLRPKNVSFQRLHLGDKWKQRLRPALVIIPLVLLIVAALIWWPMPGTSVEDNTSRAAPLQKVTTPAEETPEPAAIDSAPATDEEGSLSAPEPAAGGQALTPATETDSATAVKSTPSYRVLSYD